jgi:23S rRNA pseudouridine1911/1915/1917 synthase
MPDEPKIIYEDKDFLAVYKPAGLIVHKTKNKEEYSLVDWLIKKYPEIKNVGDEPILRPGIMHRLDKDTSGVMLVARNQKAFSYFKNLFQKHLIKKTYLALVWGRPKEKKGIIDKPIGLKSGTTKRSIYSFKMQKQAITEYKVLKSFKDETGNSFSFLEVFPKTGRTHQIRVHLKSIGHPVCGDKLYGKKDDEFKRLMLHSLSLEFSINNSKIKIESEIPKEFNF